jgi:membrane-associated HD superfamily phosphohydrolase
MMLADCCESACRAAQHHSAAQIESLVHTLSLRRFHDGQFDECDLTMRDLGRIQRSLVKTLQGMYHGRLAYPSTSNPQSSDTSAARKLA